MQWIPTILRETASFGGRFPKKDPLLIPYYTLPLPKASHVLMASNIVIEINISSDRISSQMT